MKDLRWLGAAALGGCLAACGAQDGGGGGDLRQAAIPADFTFQSTRSVALVVSADDRLFGDVADAQLVVSKASGAAVFRGAIRKGESAQVRVLAPLAEQQLKVTVSGRGGESSSVVAVGDNGKVEGRVR